MQFHTCPRGFTNYFAQEQKNKKTTGIRKKVQKIDQRKKENRDIKIFPDRKKGKKKLITMHQSATAHTMLQLLQRA